MNALTCQEVEAHLDLLAAGECDLRTRQTVECHLESCPACMASYRETQRLLGLLDLHLNDSGLARLRARIEQEDRRHLEPRARRRPGLLPFARRAMAMAAMVMLAVGLVWLPQIWQGEGAPELQLTMLEFRGNALEKGDLAVGVRANPEPAPVLMEFPANTIIVALPSTQLGEPFRRELRQAQRDGRLPPPTPVPVSLVLRNAGKYAFEVRLGDPATALTLDVTGEGVVRIPFTGAARPAYLQAQSHWLTPGQSHEIKIDRLIAGSAGRLEYIYLTEPGDCKVLARLRLWADGRPAIVQSDTLHIHVESTALPRQE